MSSETPGRPRATDVALFGFLVSLALKASLDTVYGHSVSEATSAWDLVTAVSIAPTLFVFVFLITLIRFVYGAYRFNEEIDYSKPAQPQSQPQPQPPAEQRAEQPSWSLLWNIFATLILFILFYITALSIRHSEPFFTSLLAVHVWDLIWFVSTIVTSSGLAKRLKSVMLKFILIDLLTVIVLLVLIIRFSGHYRNKAALFMLCVAAADFLWNRTFFFHPTKWRSQGANA